MSVLFADLVGFTTLSEHRDPEEVRELLSRYFERCRTLIERYGGNVEKFIGDAVMAVWGTPVAREDDAERAVRAAIALSAMVTALGEEIGMPALRVRAGVLTGHASVDLAAEHQGMVLGDTVNAASRLQALAEPGTVLVDDVTRRATEAAIEYEDAGVHHVKGREHPIHSWTALRVVAGVGGAQRSAGLEAPHVGRERELQTILRVAEDSASRRVARLVTVTGEAGMGKSRLLWEFFKEVDGIEELRWWHQGRSLSYGEGVAYWALAEMVRARAAITDEDDAATQRAKLEATIERFVIVERERRLVHPRLAQLLGLEQRTAGEAADLFAGWRLFFERMADAAPVVLAFEDLHWADSGLLDFIDHLLEWSADHPIFVLVLGRPELAERRARWGKTIQLELLPPAAMQSLLDGLVPGLAPELTARILQRAEGVPLYAVETVRMLLDRGLLTQEGSRYAVTGAVDDLEVPETLQALVAARLDNLADDERMLLQDASVLGTSFTPEAVAAVSKRPQPEVRRTLDSLVSRQVLGRNDDPRASDPGQYHFLQALLRTIALSTLSRRARKARHLAAAHYLEAEWGDESADIAEVLASHYLDAVAAEPDAADVQAIRDRARETLVVAGRRTSALALGAEAGALFQSAAELAASDAERASLLSEAGAAVARSDRDEGAQLLEGAIDVLDAAGRPEEAALTRVRLADVVVGLNRLEQAGALLAQAEPALRDPALIAEAAALRAKVAFLVGDYILAHDQSERALSIADPRRLSAVIAEAAQNKAITLMNVSRTNEAGALMALALEVALAADLPEAALRVHYNLAELRCIEGAIAQAHEGVEAGLALARERGSRAWERDLIAQGAQTNYLHGDWDRAVSVRESLAVPGAEEPYRVACVWMSLIQAARGERAALASVLSVPPPRSEWSELAMLETMARAVAIAATEQPQEAAESVASVVDELVRDAATTAAVVLDAAEILLAAGRREDAARLVGPKDRVPSPLTGSQLLQVQALLHREAGEDEEAEAALREALAGLRSIEAPFMLARCLYGLGETLLDAGRAEAEACELLREAGELFERLRASAWTGRVEALQATVSTESPVNEPATR